MKCSKCNKEIDKKEMVVLYDKGFGEYFYFHKKCYKKGSICENYAQNGRLKTKENGNKKSII